MLIDQDHNVAVSFATASMQIIDFHLPNRYNRTHIMLEVNKIRRKNLLMRAVKLIQKFEITK